MALNNQFKIKNDSNTMGRILSGGVDIATIFSPSNTSWTASVSGTNILVAGGNALNFTSNNGVSLNANSGTKTVAIAGVDATTSTKGVASFNSDDFTVTNGAVAIRTGGVDIDQLKSASTDNNPISIVVRDAAGQFSSGSVTVFGNVSALLTVTSEILNARTGFKINNAAASGNYLRGNGTNFVAGTIQAGDVPTLNQNTTGSAATLSATRTLWGQNFNGSANVTGNLTDVGNITLGTQANKATVTYTTNTARTYTIPDAGANASFVMTEGNQTINGTKTFGSAIDGSVTGSAATLTDTRTLWGQNFNGSQNITGSLTGVGNIIGSGAVTLSAAHNSNLNLVATGTGNVVIDKADINGGTIDGVSIGSSSVATYLKVDNVAVDSNHITFDNNGTINHAAGGYVAINGNSTGVEARLSGPRDADLIIGTHLNDIGRARITLDEAINGNITFATNGTGNVVIDRADINGGAIDGTPIGATTASTGRFTTIAATGNVNIDGNLFVAGSAITINATDIITKDPLIFLAQGNAGDAVDIGFAAQYTIANAVPTRFTGLIRDTASGKWNLFSGLSSSPLSSTNVVFTGDTTIVKDTLVANLEGDVTGNAGTATKLATGRIISLTGDVSGSVSAFDGSGNVSGSTIITNDAVTTSKILNSNVTYAKIQNVSATDRILGRQSAGSGVVEEITCTSAGRALLDDLDASAQRTTLGLGDAQSVTHANLVLSNGTQSVLRNVYTNSVASNSTMSVSTFSSSSSYRSAKFVLHVKQGTTRRAVAEIIAVRDDTTWEGSVYGIVDPAGILSNVDISVSSAVDLVLTFATTAAYTATVSVEALTD